MAPRNNDLKCARCGAPMVSKATEDIKLKSGKSLKYWVCPKPHPCKNSARIEFDGKPISVLEAFTILCKDEGREPNPVLAELLGGTASSEAEARKRFVGGISKQLRQAGLFDDD